MGAGTKKKVSWLSALVAALIVTIIGVHAVNAQDSAGSPMPANALQALGRNESVQRTLLPDGRELVLGSERAVADIIDPRGIQRPAHIPLPEARRFATASVLPSGRVLIWGGVDASGRVLRQGLWFDPIASTITGTNDVALQPRAGHTATVLSDGRLLVTGGWSPALGAMPEAEIWDPGSGHLQLVTNLLQPPRIGHAAILLADGRIAISGGFDTTGRPYGNVAVFDPAMQQFHAADPRILQGPNGSNTPMLAASNPRANALDFPAGGVLMLRFSEPMDVRSITTQTITLLGPGGSVPVHVVAAEGGRLAFITPPTDLYTGSHYTLFVQHVLSSGHRTLAFTAIDFSTASLQNGGTGSSHSPSGTPSVPPAGSSVSGTTTSNGVVGVAASPVADNDSAPISNGSRELHLMTGFGDVSHFILPITPCGLFYGSIRTPCRTVGRIDQGEWFPGQNNAADKSGGHWRLYTSKPSVLNLSGATSFFKNLSSTLLVGRVLRIDDSPVADVEVSIGAQKARTDASGEFVLRDVPAGQQELYVDGSTANRGAIQYGQFVEGVQINANQMNIMPHLNYVPRIALRDKVSIPSPTQVDTVITHPDMPGLELHIPAGTVIRDHLGKVVTELAIIPTPVDRAPFPTQGNFPSYFMIQPGGAVIQGLTPEAAKGVRIVYPNYGHDPAGALHDFWVYQPKDGWRVYGHGHVSSDGSQIIPDTGVALHDTMAGGHQLSGGPPPPTPNPPPDACCNGGVAADPVDLRTGLFVHHWTDFAIDDVMPLTLSRTYRPGDSIVRAFGIGTASNFGMYLYSPTPDNFETPQLVMPDGSIINYHRVLGAVGTDDGAWATNNGPNAFAGSTLYGTEETGNHPEYWLILMKDGTQLLFYAGGGNYLYRIVDRFGNQTTFYQDSGLPSKITSPSGRTLAFGYDTSNRIHTATDNSGRQFIYDYNTAGYLDTVTYPDQKKEHYTYDSAGRMQTIADRRGYAAGYVAVTNQYDSNGRVHIQTLADRGDYVFDYVTDGSGTVTQTTVTDPTNSKRVVTFDATGYPATDTRAWGQPEAQTYIINRDPATGLVSSMTDPLLVNGVPRTTTYTYDLNSNIKSISRTAGAKTVTQSFTYTPDFNQLQTRKDELGHTTTYAYNSQGCLTKITDALTNPTTITCNAAGQLLTIKDALGHITTMGYQGYDLRTVTDPLSHTVTYTSDSLGRRIAVADSLGNISRTEFDINGRVGKSVDPQGHATIPQYDENGNIASITLPNQGVIGYQYDKADRQHIRTDALSQPESWTYDGNNNIRTHTDRNLQTTTLYYDHLDRNNLTTFADASSVVTTYDAGNRATEIADSANGNLFFTPDGFDRLTQTKDAQNAIVNYTYDDAGRRKTMTPDAQAQITYTFDNANRFTKLVQGPETVALQYYIDNRRKLLTLPNGVTSTYAYDIAGRLTGITFAKGVTSIGDLGYGYDDANRRIATTGSFASDNLPAPTTGTSVFDLNDRLTSFNNVVQNYDANGNLTFDGAKTYYWNARNQLWKITQGGTAIATFTYDAMGRRTSRTEGGQTIAYLYDGMNAVQEKSGSTVTPVLAGLAIDERFARTDNGVRTYFLTDAIGSTRALTNAAGAVIQRYDYTPYGETVAQYQGFTNPYQYAGREQDQSGFYYNRARYYNPSRASFISEDPIGLASGPNSYAYVGGNPINHTDPNGLIIESYGNQDYAQATAYLMRDPWMNQIISDLDSSSTVYKMDFNSDHDDRYSNHVIHWDPTHALRAKCGAKLTPALLLGHELAHADFPDSLRDYLQSKKTGDDYENWEEKRVITGPEREAAQNLHDGIRYDHVSGDWIPVGGPLSTTPIAPF